MATIDQRLEALTHSVELLAGMHKDLLKAQVETEKSLTRMERGLNRMRRYALQIALDHEMRLSKLEEEEDEDDEKG
jgi:hypothetical protein